MPFENVVSSLSHQILSKNAFRFEGEQYYYIYESTVIEIREFLLEMLKRNKRFVVNLFGEWNKDFLEFQEEKSKPFSKDLIVSFSDGSEWSVKIIDLVSLMDNLERDENTSEIIIDTKNPLLQNEAAMMNWASENLDWNLLSEVAEEIKRPTNCPDYASEWKDATKRIIAWDDKVNMFDIMSLTSINESDEEDDD